MTVTDPCLVCGSTYQVENAHWPKAVGIGRSRKKVKLPTLPICIRCHEFGQHMGDETITLTLIAKAPDWWRMHDEWEFARPWYERFVAKREYLEAVR